MPPKGGDLLSRIKRQPGGKQTWEAERFLYGLAKQRELPGFRKGESGNVVFAPASSDHPHSDTYPVHREFDSTIQGASSVYHYVVIRDSSRSVWRLQRAWQTDRDGVIIEEFVVP